MRILILTAIPFWHPGTGELIEQLRENGIEVEALDIFHGTKIDTKGRQVDLLKMKGILRKIYLKFFRKSFTRKHISTDQIIDIHFVEPLYSKYLLDLPNKIICTLFGSDLFRTTNEQKNQQAPLFERADGILLSKNMIPFFEKYFPAYTDKYILNQYGSKRIDVITSKLNDHVQPVSFRFPSDKKVVCIGYNGKKEQQHLEIIKELAKDSDLLKKIHLVIPMTYGVKGDYADSVYNQLKKLNCSFDLIRDRLSDHEITDLWLSTDININMQTTDALASSIKEAMSAGNIMLIGEWLPYDIYREIGIVYEEVNFENLTLKLNSTIDNFDDLHASNQKNPEIISGFASWSSLIKSWIASYERILNGSKQ